MMRALYSGVAGLKTHMSRLDVIGNNIANVNTYGFKSSRATFRDVMTQQVRGASAGTTTRGGINPSEIGYGSQLSSIDLQMGPSALTNTGNSLDLAITGDGFFQVQDADGNIYYTKAGMLDIDTEGRLVDTNGNFILGTTATSGKLDSNEPGSSIIKITVDPVEPAYGALTAEVLGNTLTITSNAQTNLSNVSFTISASNTKTNGEPFYTGETLEVVMEKGSSNITVRLNESHHFQSMTELSNAINDQIKAINDGNYEGGEFTFAIDGFPADGLTGGEIASSRDNGTLGQIDPANKSNVSDLWNGVSFVDTFGEAFSTEGTITQMTYAPSGTDSKDVTFTVEITPQNDDGTPGTPVMYTGTLSASAVGDNGNVIKLYKGTTGVPAGSSDTDYMGIKIPKAAYDAFVTTNTDPTAGPVAPAATLSSTATDPASLLTGAVKSSKPSTSLGLGKQTWTLDGGTEGGPQSYADVTGVSIGPDGTITGSHPVHGRLVLGRIDLANFVNPAGLSQSGNSYYVNTASSGEARLAIPGEGGTGVLKGSSLEMSNVDLSQEFSDMIVTQRGYQANARIITVSDTMLEELVNLKR